ncbi:hypothetical protein RHGRI_015807 [Rhododendron griersonianum]|uniref:PLATZ transcription factor family protein n=1 Tax=Rhododendron griersonianum TaxID=479676 RepID=A0AAV6JNL0_9ERIC|nr:hypothetical protein RHGRI_022300 [Rhododendron griersonianum]KAG5534655.1 hypothetical protein RHGRI_022694 [Rhododendron griersonianum]KAG5537223.1 hypothetical protein RHGRI_024611 [Rhododendron griersonianum]KAG5542826.1 hypothetical protein RHGRI_015807 [Rhododendron griersonianum]
MEKEETPYPPWLKPMLKARFFSTCEIHGSCKEKERNHYCLDCTTDALCPCCLIHHKNHRQFQIRRSSYHEIIKVEDIQRYLDVSDIQPYTMNKAPVLFLNKRPQVGPRKGYQYACDICQRSIARHSKFCSLGCKLEGIEDGIPKLTFNTSTDYHTDELRGGIEVNQSSKEARVTGLDTLKEQAPEPFHSPVSEITETMNSPSPPGLPTYNHSNSRKRKGIPRRASLY